MASCEFALSEQALSFGYGCMNGEVQHLQCTRPPPLTGEVVDGKWGGSDHLSRRPSTNRNSLLISWPNSGVGSSPSCHRVGRIFSHRPSCHRTGRSYGTTRRLACQLMTVGARLCRNGQCLSIGIGGWHWSVTGSAMHSMRNTKSGVHSSTATYPWLHP